MYFCETKRLTTTAPHSFQCPTSGQGTAHILQLSLSDDVRASTIAANFKEYRLVRCIVHVTPVQAGFGQTNEFNYGNGKNSLVIWSICGGVSLADFFNTAIPYEQANVQPFARNYPLDKGAIRRTKPGIPQRIALGQIIADDGRVTYNDVAVKPYRGWFSRQFTSSGAGATNNPANNDYAVAGLWLPPVVQNVPTTPPQALTFEVYYDVLWAFRGQYG